MKFRKKPVVIEAWQYGKVYDLDRPLWIKQAQVKGTVTFFSQYGGTSQWMEIATLEGTMRAEIGDWIIQGVNGEIYPCKPDIFDKTYELVEGEGKK